MRYLFLIICISIFSHVQGQDNTIDSLKVELQKIERDTQKVNLLNEISLLLWGSDPELSRKYATEAREIAEEINYKKGLAYAYKHIGLTYYAQSNSDQILYNWEPSLNIFKELNDSTGISNLLTNLAAVYYNAGDYTVALDYNLRALEIAEKTNDIPRLFTALLNIGAIYFSKKETHDKALYYYNRSLDYLNQVPPRYEGNVMLNLGGLYLEKKLYDSALYCLERSLVAFKGDVGYTRALSTKGKVLVEKGDTFNGLKLQKEAIELSKEKYQDQETYSDLLIKLGQSYLKLNKPELALPVFLLAEETAINYDLKNHLKNAYAGLSSVYSTVGDWKEAYKYKDLLINITDTLYSIESAKKLNALQLNYTINKKQDEIDLLAAANEIQQLETNRQRAISWSAGIVGFLLLILAVGIFRRYKFMRKIKAILEKEKGRSDDLLLNILPAETAEELKEKGEAEAKYYESSTILFTDFKGFTTISATMTPGELVKNLHECFKMFDIIITRHGLEKIKTIGDAYMAAGGIPKTNATHPVDVAKAALEIRNYMDKFKETRIQQGRPYFEVRIGMHTGPIVSGIVGIKKFAYDIWGDTVNIAARMESTSEPGKINISENTFELIKDQFKCSYRGEIEAKNRGKLKMYFLNEAYNEEVVSSEKDDKKFADIKFVH
ncbi:MAG: adenylate/guanylate cyclase domain-containing protein [Candidatus Cyclobacteriaceae bacterium M2_1C_046]